MDFSRLPDIAFLKILEYLPLEECIRAGRVNKSFRRIAQLTTSSTKCLDLTEDRFLNLTSHQLAIILDLCSPNLQRIKFGDGFRVGRYRQLATTFSNYEYPRMIDIDLGSNSVNHAIFVQLIRNSPNMESLMGRGEFVGFPAFTTVNNLKKLCLNVNSDASLRTLIGRCPNLEEMKLHAVANIVSISANVLDEFLASIPKVQRIDLAVESVKSIEFVTKMVNFWNLPLTILRISFDDSYEDVFLRKVATSFPHLQELRLGEVEPTNADIELLAGLQDLEILHLSLCRDGESYDQGIRQLAHCQKLRELDVCWSKISGGTLVNLIRSRPLLEYVGVWEITQVDTSDEAVVILNSLAGIPQREITISFLYPSETLESILKGEPVKAAIMKLEENDGLKIKIVIVERRGW